MCDDYRKQRLPHFQKLLDDCTAYADSIMFMEYMTHIKLDIRDVAIPRRPSSSTDNPLLCRRKFSLKRLTCSSRNVQTSQHSASSRPEPRPHRCRSRSSLGRCQQSETANLLPTLKIDELWYDPPCLTIHPKLRTDDSRFDRIAHTRKIYCDGCAKSFTFKGAGFGGDGAYAFVPKRIFDSSTKSEAIATLGKLYITRYWNATWFCPTCWKAMYWQQDQLELSLNEAQSRLQVVNEKFDKVMNRCF